MTTSAWTADGDFVAAFTTADDLGLRVEFLPPTGLFVDANNRQDIALCPAGLRDLEY